VDEKRKPGMSRGGVAGRHPDGPSAGHPIPGIGEGKRGGTHGAPTADAVIDHPGGRDVGAGAAGTAGMEGRERTERPGRDDPGTSGGIGSQGGAGGAVSAGRGKPRR
jgi:hypothetical protein